MNKEKIGHIEKLLGRELAEDEQERLARIQDILGIADNDALWDILIALEYQRTFYEALPKKISGASGEIIAQLSAAADKEVAHAQSRLAEAVVEHAKSLSLNMRLSALVIPGLWALVSLLLFGCLLMWAGYCIGAGDIQNQTQPLAMLLRMPAGVLIGGLCFSGGIFSGIMAATDFAGGSGGWKKWAAWSVGMVVTALKFITASCLLYGWSMRY